MGSTRLPNLSLNGSFLYYKNLFNSEKSFWYYYYFFFFSNYVMSSLFKDSFLIKFSKQIFFNLNNIFKVSNYQKNIYFLGSINLFKIQNWLVINLFIYNSENLNFRNLNSFNSLNLKILNEKKKNLNYKNLIK